VTVRARRIDGRAYLRLVLRGAAVAISAAVVAALFSSALLVSHLLAHIKYLDETICS
jgi:hypothetical protein